MAQPVVCCSPVLPRHVANRRPYSVSVGSANPRVHAPRSVRLVALGDLNARQDKFQGIAQSANQSGKALGHLPGQRKAEETAPVLHHQGYAGQVERADKGNKAVTREVEGVYRVVGGLVRASGNGNAAATYFLNVCRSCRVASARSIMCAQMIFATSFG
jgi:hypothetical protein